MSEMHDPSVLCDRFIGLFRTHSFTRFFTAELTAELNQGHIVGGGGGGGGDRSVFSLLG